MTAGPPERETKTCPDCAETVLAAARKCRFCGYRFDEPRAGAARSLLERLGISRRTRPPSFDEVLADWGIAIAAGEEIACFSYVELDGQPGYLLVTDRRMLFIVDHPQRREQEPVFEHRRSQLTGVEAAHSGRRLTVRGVGFEHVISVGARHASKELLGALEQLSAGR